MSRNLTALVSILFTLNVFSFHASVSVTNAKEKKLFAFFNKKNEKVAVKGEGSEQISEHTFQWKLQAAEHSAEKIKSDGKNSLAKKMLLRRVEKDVKRTSDPWGDCLGEVCSAVVVAFFEDLFDYNPTLAWILLGLLIVSVVVIAVA